MSLSNEIIIGCTVHDVTACCVSRVCVDLTMFVFVMVHLVSVSDWFRSGVGVGGRLWRDECHSQEALVPDVK